MLEARAFIKNFDNAKEILKERGAIYKGEYKIHDVIFASKDPRKTLADEFLRLRLVLKNIWDEKEVIVAIKHTELKEIGKNSVVPFKKEFTSDKEARRYIDENLLDAFRYVYEFGRTGWQYDLGNDQVDLEDIEGHCSIEIKSATEDGLHKLASIFQMKDILQAPSVVAVKEILKR